MRKEVVYVGGLLHDIGKFVERSKSYDVSSKFKDIKFGHPKHSAQLLDVLRQRSSFFKRFSEDLINLVLYHHTPRNDWEKILQLADWLSSVEREKDDNEGIYYTVPLMPVFARLYEVHREALGYELAPLSLSQGFPKNNVILDSAQYKRLVDAFLKECSMVTNEVQLYYLLEKYLWCVPAQTTNYVPDISLFDHAKTTAAIALCLYEQYTQGYLTPEELRKMNDNDRQHFLLIKGDVSGIQNFIYNVPSKGAAKTLKGHSVYIGLLTDVVARYIVKELELREANVVYNGGGCFYILAPLACESKIQSIKTRVARYLLDFHQGDIYLALDYVTLAPKDFEQFSYHWTRVSQKVNIVKSRKWAEIGLAKNYDLVFGPIGVGTDENGHCYVCGAETTVRFTDDDIDKPVCGFCNSFRQLTNDLKDADCLVIKEVSSTNKVRALSYQDVFEAFGFQYIFAKRKDLRTEERQCAYLLNNTDFLEEGYAGYKFGAFRLPMENDRQLTFQEIAEKSTGDQKLALVKLDVDNLGDIFAKGLGSHATISRVTSLSRMLSLFFEGYINHLIASENWEQHLYVVFSGGDDTFIVGSWDKVLDFVGKFRERFGEFTGGHPRVSFSAGIKIVSYDYPISMSSRLTEKALEDAKSFVDAGEGVASKDKVSLFGEVFNWVEFTAVQDFKDRLLKIMKKYTVEKKGETFGRAFLYRIDRATLGFKRILAESLQGRVDHVRFWRFAYYLRDLARDDAVDLISIFKEIVLYNLLDKPRNKRIRNVMIIPAAVKWAQLATRKVSDEK